MNIDSKSIILSYFFFSFSPFNLPSLLDVNDVIFQSQLEDSFNFRPSDLFHYHPSFVFLRKSTFP